MEWVRDAASKRLFEAFVAQTAGGLFGAGYLMTGDALDAEGAVQETFIRVARRWHRVRSMDNPSGYARRVLIGVLLDGARRRSRQRAELESPEPTAEVPDDRAARALREVDDFDELRRGLSVLSPRQRAVLVLRYWADLPAGEVAEILGCSVATVTSTASRATTRLAVALAEGRSDEAEPRQARRAAALPGKRDLPWRGGLS
jgi:RNA polymerase sigma-70 factor (sigma-E family)